MNNHIDAEAVDSTQINQFSSYSLPERIYRRDSELQRDLVVVFMKQVLHIVNQIQIT